MLGVRYKDVLAETLADKASVWHYATEFGELWADSFETEQPVVIIWDRAPLGVLGNRDDRLLEPHLTPLDWALAWSLNRARQHKPLPAIVIIDTGVDKWGGSWTWTVRRQLLADMSWVALTAPVPRLDGVSELHDWTMALQALDGLAVDRGAIRLVDGDWTVATGWVSRLAEAEEVTALEALNQVWTASLIRSDEHHDINNIVGARILLQRVGEQVDNEVVGAFLQKVDWVSKDKGAQAAWRPWRNDWPKDHLYGEKVNVTLYDDMHEALWGEFLLQFLDNLEIDGGAEETPNELIDFLTKRAVFERRDFIQNAYEPSNGQPEIIFLDLRIYGDGSREQFKANTRTLLAKATQLADCPTLAWRDRGTSASLIGNKEISEIMRWLEAGAVSGDPCEDKALLLLPRLLALALPLTPIVLFSSTGQASVREKLKAYRNIFTGFQKPNPLGDPASIESATEALSVALDLAMPMLRRRMQLAYVQNVAEELERRRPTERPSKHLEIYFDETGPMESLFSTAAIAQFASLEAADAVIRTLWEASTPPAIDVLMKASRLRRQSARSELKRFETISKGRCEKIDITSVFCRDMPIGVLDESLSAFIDGPLDEGIYLNICFILFCYIEYYYDNSTIIISIPTRRVDYIEDVNLRNNLNKKFGLQNYPGYVVTYGDYAGFPLVRGWLQSWGKLYESVSKNIKGIVTKTISSHNQVADKSKGRLLHHIADWAAGFVAVNGDVSHRTTVETIRPIMGGNLFNSLHISSAREGNIKCLAEVLKLVESMNNSDLSQAICLLSEVPVVQAIGQHKLPHAWQSQPQEHLWLWRISPHVVNADGHELLSGL